MAIGDFFTFGPINAGGVYQNFVPAGGDKWLCLSMGSGTVGTLYVYDGVTQSNCCVGSLSPASNNGAWDIGNLKAVFDNTDYCRLNSANQVHAMFVQVE